MKDYQIYLILINILGLLFGGVSLLWKNVKIKKYTNIFLAIISLFGGTLGVLLSFFLLDRRVKKENAMIKIFVLCLLIVQIIFYLIFCNSLTINFSFNNSFIKNKYILFYLILINVLSFIVYGIDKYKAVNNKRRIRIVSLLLLAFIGGSIGSLFAMYLFRHKTNKTYFKFGIPIILVTQIIFYFFLISL